MGEPFPDRAYISEGWIVRDVPWINEDLWIKMIQVMGGDPEGVRVLGHTVKHDVYRKNNYVRGTILVSPEGYEAARKEFDIKGKKDEK